MGAPAPLTAFVGRRRELAVLRRMLRTSRLLTLAAAGGLGKTRLALQLTTSFAAEDVLWLDLAPLRFPADMRDWTVSGFDRRRPRLFVFDNADHHLEQVGQMAAEALARDPAAHVLVTSRRPLHMAGEVVWRVPPLRLPDPAWAHDPVRSLRTDAVRLFVDRASAADGSFALDAATCADVVETCMAVDGIPLAIELAAAQFGHFGSARRRRDAGPSTAETAPVPGDAGRDAVTRVIDQTHSTLGAEARTMFRRVSIFADSFSLGGARAVYGDDGPGHSAALSELVDCSLLAHTGTRYAFLQPIREYAFAQLAESDEVSLASERAVGHLTALFRRLAQSSDADGPAQMREEFNNVIALVPWLLERDAASVIDVLSRYAQLFWSTVPVHLSVLATWTARAVDVYRARDAVRARGLASLARLMLELREDVRGARRSADEAVAAAQASGDDATLGIALRASSSVAVEERDRVRAIRELDRAIPLLTDAEHETRAMALSVRGVMKQIAGDDSGSRSDLAEAFATWQMLDPGRRGLRYLTLLCAADIDIRTGDRASAARNIRDALAACIAMDVPRPAPFEHLANLTAIAGNDERAVRLSGIADRLKETTGTWPSSFFMLSDRTWMQAAEARLGKRTASRLRSEGRSMASPAANAYAIGDRDGPLTDREEAIARALSEGLTDKEIARRLGISERTVENHVQHIRDKLGLRSRTQIALWHSRVEAASVRA